MSMKKKELTKPFFFQKLKKELAFKKQDLLNRLVTLIDVLWKANPGHYPFLDD